MILPVLITLVVAAHLAFVLIVPAGWIVLLRGRRSIVIGLHGMISVWAALSSTLGLSCPLTRMELFLRQLAGWDSYDGRFLEYYCVPVLRNMHLAQFDLLSVSWEFSAILSVLGHAYLLHRRMMLRAATAADRNPTEEVRVTTDQVRAHFA